MIFKRHIFLIVFLLLFGTLLFYKLSIFPKPLFDWDESLYVQNGLEMLEHRSFLVPFWQGQPWLDKPPLSPLLLGIVAKLLPLPVEISTRLYTLALSIIALVLIYKLYLKAGQSRLTAVLTVIITAFTPIFLQRSQVVSLDVTLLIGWLGFFLWLEKPILSVLFLFLSVQSKSLLGFYPLAIYGLDLVYLWLIKEIKTDKLWQKIRIIIWQASFLSLWYLIALLVYQEHFVQAHLIESHFRRVSASLESHFGQRTYYLDLMADQLGWLGVLALIGFGSSLIAFWQKKISHRVFLLQNAFLPWFLFLNLTKTKIAWYLYPVIPQFAFYAGYSLTILKPKLIRLGVFVILGGYLIYQGIIQNNLLGTFYSQEDAHIKIAKTARQKCDNLAVLVPDYTRETYWTLKKMNLIIESTSWWGEHPSMVYYFGKPLRFYYSVNDFKKVQDQADCFVINSPDQKLVKKNRQLIVTFDKMLLYR